MLRLPAVNKAQNIEELKNNAANVNEFSCTK
jgi:hypothetical protein